MYTVSTKADDFFIIHVNGDFDSVMSSLFKTEFVTVLSERYLVSARKPLQISFSDK